MRKLHIVTNPKVTVKETIYNCHGMDVSPCKREKDNNCPENGMRWRHAVASFSLCPWVMTIHGYLSFHTLDDIPNKVLFSQDTQYSLASVILFDGSHFKGISLDAKNSQGSHLIYEGMNGPANRIRINKMDDPISNYADGYKILELWYVKVDSSSAEIGSASPSTTLKPVGIPNLGHTCYLTTLVQIIFWVIPPRKRLIEYELSNRDSKKTIHFRCTRGWQW